MTYLLEKGENLKEETLWKTYV